MAIMTRIWKLAGANEPDVTCLALWGGLVLSLTTLTVVLMDRLRPQTADVVDLALASLLVFSGALGSFLALRGNTYDETRAGSWNRKITREGRAAIVILSASVVVAVGKEVLSAEHADSHAAEQQMKLAQNSKLAIDTIGGRLAVVQQTIQGLIEDNGDSINAAEENRLRGILGQLATVRSAADSSGEVIVEKVALLSTTTDGLLTRLVSGTQDLAMQGNATLSAIHEGRTEVQAVAASVVAVDTLLKAYQNASSTAIMNAGNAHLAVRTSVDSLKDVVGTLQAALGREQELQVTINRLSSENGTLQGRVAELQGRVDAAELRLQRTAAQTQPPATQTQQPRDSTAAQ
jgi:hypothetical protein